MSKQALELINKCIETQDTELDLGNCGLRDKDFKAGGAIDMALRKCTHITSLIFSSTWEIVDESKNFSSSNHGEDNQLSQIPVAVMALTRLQRLVCAGKFNSNWNIADTSIILHLKALTYLDLSHNCITRSTDYSRLHKLEHLFLKDNKITDISPLATLTGLQQLSLGHNSITDISCLEQLTGLKYLSLTANQIADIDCLKKLTGLLILRIGENQIHDISGLEQLTALQTLQAYANNIKDISCLERLFDLQHLSLGKNQISDISPLKQLTNLKRLSVNYNKISDITPLKKLTHLQHLYINRNKISDLNALAKLYNLQHLLASENNISDVSCLKKLASLREMFLEVNNISDISPLKTLTNLQYLYAGHNKINNISSVEKLINLKILDLPGNQVSDITAIEKLPDLLYLNLRNNQVKHIDALKNHPSLQAIDIYNNQVKDITPLLSFISLRSRPLQIKHTEAAHSRHGEIHLANNPITTPPVEVVKQGNEAILRYFEKINEEGVDYLHEAKLTLVGEGCAGKTSLQKRLLNATAALPKEDTRTRGIQVVDWKYKGAKSKSHIAHIWDFGGQDVYYPVHRFFITENSVFVLLASTRQTSHNFDYWIPTIFQFGGKSPVILGQTCHQGNKVSWNDIGHYLGDPNFNIIKTSELPYTEIDLLNGNEGLNEIKKAIIGQIEKLPHYGKGVPKSWIPAREAIAQEAQHNACISLEAFGAICKSTNARKFASNADVCDFAQFLHALGIVLWYVKVEELQNWVILQPEWAMNAVYRIIDDEEIQKRRGHILSRDFNRVWKDPCYQHRFGILKKMLQEFKIAFPKKHNVQDFIIPARLPSIPAEKKWNNDEPCLRLTYKYKFMPRGLVNQLSAHLSRHITSNEDVWNDAVNFTYENDRAEAQVTENFHDRTINIFVKGKDARGLLMIIRDAMQDVIESYRGVQPSIIVPCSCDVCKTSNQPTPFEYDRLQKWSETRNTVTCNESNTQLSINELLYNVALPNHIQFKKEMLVYTKEIINKIYKQPNNRHPSLKAFISYSKFDGESAKDGHNYLEDFKKHLAPLTGYNNLLQTWDDTLLIAGEEWDDRIKEELNNSDVIFLLISPDFLNTKYIKDVELEIAITRHNNKECVVVPVVIKPCGWTDIGFLSKLSGIPRKGLPVASWQGNKQWHSVDDAWNHVYKQVKELLQHFTDTHKTQMPEML